MKTRIIILMPCKLCESADRNDLERAIALGELTISETAEKIDTTESKVWKHMEEHMDSPKMPTDRDELLETLINRLYVRVRDLLDQPLETGTERSLEGHVRQLRGLIKDITELKGELGRKATKYQEIDYNEWSRWLMNNLCKDCKSKFADFLVTRNRESKK